MSIIVKAGDTAALLAEIPGTHGGPLAQSLLAVEPVDYDEHAGLIGEDDGRRLVVQ